MEAPEPLNPFSKSSPHSMPGDRFSNDSISELAELFDQSPNLFLRCDENGQLIYANRFLASSIGPNGTLPDPLLRPCQRAVRTKTSQVCEATFDFDRYLFVIIPDPDKKRVTIHGKELVSDYQTENERLKAKITLLEKEKQMLAALLSQAQKLDASGALARSVLRKFSNIMTSISGYTGLCIEKTGENDPSRYFLNQIRDISNEGLEIIRQVNLFCKNAPQGFKPLDCNAAIMKVLPLFKGSIEDAISFETHLSPGLRPIMGNRELIEQAIVNLVLCGIRSMPAGGRLTVRTSNVTIDDDYCKTNSEAKPGPFVLISVADIGACMDKESLPHFFDLCARIKHDSRGLELPVACLIVKRHGGWVTGESRRETGSEVRVYLPEGRLEG